MRETFFFKFLVVMSFGGFPSKSSGENMVADGLFSYNVMSTAANSMQMFSSPPLSLALVCTLSLPMCLFVCV